ncbi:ABC transporter substrate-binding protein [Burkholderia sp. Bp9131]|uniref:ABC transporter substrate-binding protein n=1 Tax=Burkholderia sp. Bp9131 TaxID=2184571 RepID=UPI001C8A0C96|nr:ABC transporter substrate-binding protein [Burkholderia sp. Bp9131]
MQAAKAADDVPAQSVDAALHARLPEEIRKRGVLTAVNNSSFPPYEIVTDDRQLTGASAELAEALGQVLGVKIRHETINGLSSLLSGIKAGRYQFAMGPIGDFPDRQKANDFVDYVREYVVFAVLAGNPKHIATLEDTCGKRIAVMAGGSAEKVIRQQSQKCIIAGKQAVEVQSFSDQATSTLAVRSNRSDAFFSSLAPLTYYVGKTNGALVLTFKSDKNGYGDLYQGAVVPKGSPLGPLFRDGLQKLFDNGTYAKIMKKWGLEGNKLRAPGVNLAKDDVK